MVFNAITESIIICWCQNDIKMQSSYLLILYSGIPTSEFLPGSVHHRAGIWVFFPGLECTFTEIDALIMHTMLAISLVHDSLHQAQCKATRLFGSDQSITHMIRPTSWSGNV